MKPQTGQQMAGISRQAEEQHLADTLAVVHDNIESYSRQVRQMQADIDEMLDHYHDNDVEVLTLLNNTITLNDHMKRALQKNEKAQSKPYFGRIVFYDETFHKQESIYIGRGGISRDATHQLVADWRAPVSNAYYENGLGKCSYSAPGGPVQIDLQLKRTFEIEDGTLLDYFDSEVIANDDLLTKYLSKNKQAVLGEIVATIQKEQNEIIRKSPYHNIIVQGVAGSGKTTVAMHRISYILYNYAERIRPDDFYIIGSNRILLDYITGVLPDLDVYGIRQMTMEQLFVRLLYEDWDEKKYRIRQNDRSDSRGSVKGSLSWFRELKAFCDELEWDTICRDSVYLNPKQFVEGFQDGKTGVFDRTGTEPADPSDLILLVDGEAVERYIRQNPGVSLQNKINMLNQRLQNKINDEFLGKDIRYTEAERKAIRKAYRSRYGGRTWKRSLFLLYQDFLTGQTAKGYEVEIPSTEFDVYDLAALAYLYKRIKETEVISEAHHIVIDEAQDFGMMAYAVLNFCIRDCSYTIMGDVSQNIHFGFGLNDWEELKQLLLTTDLDSFGILKKSYRNTVEISRFATDILHHGQFPTYPVEPIIRHGEPVQVRQAADRADLIRQAAAVLKAWQEKGFDTMAVVCRDQKQADLTVRELSRYVDVMESDLEKAVFGSGILVLPVEYTKGLEFDTVLILDPDRADYPVDDGHARLLYVAATRALHELFILHTGNLTGLIADPVPERQEAPSMASPSPAVPTAQISGHSPDLSSGCAAGRQSSPAPDKKEAILDEKEAILAAKRRQAQSKQASSASLRENLPAAAHPAPRPSSPAASGASPARPQSPSGPRSRIPAFGAILPTEKLRPAGHSPIDLSVRWVKKESDGLYIQSRYGLLRLSPIRGNIIRVTFSRSGSITAGTHPGIAVDRPMRFWTCKDASHSIDLFTDELRLHVDKSSGSIQYLTKDGKPLLAERSRECRQLEAAPDGTLRSWLFLSWFKREHLCCPCPGDSDGKPADQREFLELNGQARYISQGAPAPMSNPAFRKSAAALPLVISDKGYGILMASDGPTVCCDIRPAGPYLYTETQDQLDFYFLSGKWRENIWNSYEYLCKERSDKS